MPLPDYGELEKVGAWVMEVFQLEAVPEYFWYDPQDFKEFKKYLESKGPYTPSKPFLDYVLQKITSSDYTVKTWWANHQALQNIETKLFYQSGGFKSFVQTAVASACQTGKRLEEAKRVGVQVEIDRSILDEKKEGVPTLQTLCARTLLKSGYPQKHIQTKEI